MLAHLPHETQVLWDIMFIVGVIVLMVALALSLSDPQPRTRRRPRHISRQRRRS